MAKKDRVNKSEAVRDYYREHPEAKAAEVAEALTKNGITITAAHVTTIKSKSKIRRRRRRRAVKAVAEKTGIGVADIKAALGFLKACGSTEAAKEALAAAIQIKAMV